MEDYTNNFPLYKILKCVNMKRNNTSIVTGTTMPKPTTNNTNNNPNNTLDTGDPNKKLAGINMLINLTIWNKPIVQYTNPRPIPVTNQHWNLVPQYNML